MENRNLKPEDLDALDRMAKKQSSPEEEARLRKRMASEPQLVKHYRISRFLYRVFQRTEQPEDQQDDHSHGVGGIARLNTIHHR